MVIQWRTCYNIRFPYVQLSQRENQQIRLHRSTVLNQKAQRVLWRTCMAYTDTYTNTHYPPHFEMVFHAWITQHKNRDRFNRLAYDAKRFLASRSFVFFYYYLLRFIRRESGVMHVNFLEPIDSISSYSVCLRVEMCPCTSLYLRSPLNTTIYCEFFWHSHCHSPSRRKKNRTHKYSYALPKSTEWRFESSHKFKKKQQQRQLASHKRRWWCVIQVITNVTIADCMRHVHVLFGTCWICVGRLLARPCSHGPITLFLPYTRYTILVQTIKLRKAICPSACTRIVHT